MPTYQYACTACDERHEAVQSFTDAPLTECPACAGPLRKVFSAVGVVFKGSGFYKNDSRGKAPDTAKADSGTGGAKTETTSAPAASSGSDSSSTTKPSAPAAPAPASKSA